MTFADTENVLKRWLLTTSVAALVMRSAGQYSIYLAMPNAAPNPAVVIRLVGGGPVGRSDLPEQSDRIQFDCWGRTRDEASLIARTLMGELDALNRGPGWVDSTSGAYLGAAVPVVHLWLPDPEADTPRYIVDALITTVT